MCFLLFKKLYGASLSNSSYVKIIRLVFEKSFNYLIINNHSNAFATADTTNRLVNCGNLLKYIDNKDQPILKWCFKDVRFDWVFDALVCIFIVVVNVFVFFIESVVVQQDCVCFDFYISSCRDT